MAGECQALPALLNSNLVTVTFAEVKGIKVEGSAVELDEVAILSLVLVTFPMSLSENS